MTLRFFSFFFLLAAFFSGNANFLHAEGAANRPIVVGYFGQWSLYNEPRYTLHDLAKSGKAGLLDQLNYAQGFVTGGHCSIADRNADLDHTFGPSDSVDGSADDPASAFRGQLHQLAELKRAFPHLKTFISLEGQAADFAADAQPAQRAAFVASCVDLFVRGNLAQGISQPGLFDGIDVDWEYPHEPDAANFVALLQEFRRQMDAVRPGLRLSVAVGPSPRMYPGSDFRAVASEVDEVGLMTYDMAGPWMQQTGFIAPLYRVPPPDAPAASAPTPQPAPTGAQPTASTTPAAQSATPAGTTPSSTPAPHPPPSGGVAGSVQAYIAAGVPPEKLLIGLPFYGYGWTSVPEVANGLYQEGVPVRGDRPYRFIASLADKSTVYRDPASSTPWLFDGDAFWTFDDPVSVEAKSRYAAEHNLGGCMIWELAGDSAEGALLTAAHDGLVDRVAHAEIRTHQRLP